MQKEILIVLIALIIGVVLWFVIAWGLWFVRDWINQWKYKRAKKHADENDEWIFKI